jgi:mannose-1-phosphate guanylyltransferase
MEHYYPLIMAGGGGTRLWPLSRKDTPKQLLPLIDEHSMFRTCVLRLLPLFAPEQIYIVTGRDYVDMLHADTPEIPRENFIAEPYGKNTGPAVGLAMTTIQQRDPQATVAILTADHHIGKADDFRQVLKAAHEFAQHDHIVTLGISPTFPSTGFGYIQQGETLAEAHGFTGYQSLGFKEKPDLETATQFLASGDYSWNSGMFIWKAERALAEFKRQQPEMYAKLMELAPSVDTPQYETQLTEVWESLPAKSLDYAIMEGAENVTVIPADIGWSDVGAWDALFDVLELDSSGNGHKGSGPERIILDNQNTFVYSDRLTVTIGVDDLIVVDTDDVLLICHKDRAQDVRTVVDQLRAAKNERYL